MKVGRIIVSALCFVFLLLGNSATATAAPLPPGTAIVYGDSLTMESRFAIGGQALKKKGWTFVNHSYGGTAPCEWIQWLGADLAQYHPSVIAITTAGNTETSSCIKDPMGSASYFAKYQADLDTFFSMATASGAKVVYFNAPPFGDPVRDSAVRKINQLALQLAYRYHGVSIAGGIRSILGGNTYTAYKSCLANETLAMGCVNKLIPIRTIPPAFDAGLHLCPTGLIGTNPVGACPTYSSGEVRFGRTLVNSTVAPPAPKLP